MVLCKSTFAACVLLLVLLGALVSVADDNIRSNSVVSTLKCPKTSAKGSTDNSTDVSTDDGTKESMGNKVKESSDKVSFDNDITVSTATSKAPRIGKLERINATKEGHYGFIEHSYRTVKPLIKKDGPGPLLSNTWRINCSPGRSIFAVLMSMQLACDDYLQLKLKQVNGTINHQFHSMYFSKKSILVSLGRRENRDIFTGQSSFLLGYMCVATVNLQKAKDLMINSDKVLQYMRCRPHTFEKLAQELVKPEKIASFPNTPDMRNILNLQNPTSCLAEVPECTNMPEVEIEDYSAEGED